MMQIRSMWRYIKKEESMNHFVPRRLLLASLCCLVISPLHAVVNVEWNDVVSSGNGTNNTNGPIQTSGDDIILNITDSCVIEDNVDITVDSANTVTFDLNGASRTISANGDGGQNSVLRYNVTDNNGQVVVNVTQPLFYSGIEAGNTLGGAPAGGAANDEQLLVLVEAPGRTEADGPAVEYVISDNASLGITNGADGGPVTPSKAAEHYVVAPAGAAEQVGVRFRRASNSDNNANIGVDQFGVLGYVAQSNNVFGRGVYQFDASNSTANTGRLVFAIGDEGRVNLRNLEATNDPITGLGDIDKAVLAGNNDGVPTAEFEVMSPGSWGGMLLLNQNEIMPRFRSNPFCEDRGGGDPLNDLNQPGFIVDSNGIVTIQDNAYLDYIVAAPNQELPGPSVISSVSGGASNNQLIKPRSAAALFIDGGPASLTDPGNPGNFDPFVTPRATIDFQGDSKLYFRSGVDADGNVPDGTNFLVPAVNQLSSVDGFGTIVFDIEAPLDVNGIQGNSNAINVLSLREDNIGGTVFVEDDPADQSPGAGNNTPVFKTRPFSVDGQGFLEQYGKAAVLNNSRTFINDAALQHTDAIHRVFTNNTSQQSEPTYIGGERLCDRDQNDTISFTNKTIDLTPGNSTTLAVSEADLELSHDDNTDDLTATATLNGNTVTQTIADGNNVNVNIGGYTINVENDVAGSGEVNLDVDITGLDVIRFKLRQWRPAFVFKNSQFRLNDSTALTGVDLVVPEINADTNISDFIFYSNGYSIDQGTGRNLILGTTVGALAADANTIVDRDSHLDVQQEDQANNDTGAHLLRLLAAENDNQVTRNLTDDPDAIAGQFSVHSVFLAHGSNISVGASTGGFGESPENGFPVDLQTDPTIQVDGSFFSFGSQGGRLNKPELSVLSGQGAVFVGENGVFELSNNRRAQFNVMFGRNGDGTVDLKEQLASFGDGFGIQQVALDLTDANQRTIVGSNKTISNFVLDWKFIRKDFDNFTPYIPQGLPVAGSTTAPTAVNVASLPSVEGRVGQLQIQNSRLGDPAHVMVDGGSVRELVFMKREDGAMPQLSVLSRDNNPDPGIAPVGVIVTRNNARVGIGPVPTSNESSEASVTLGTNGVTLMPDGTSEVTLNSNVVIDNTAHIVPGPNFNNDTFTLTSVTDRELRIKGTGVLDLSLFDTNKKFVLGGKVTLVAEPGARIITGGGTFEVTDEARIFADQTLMPFGGTTNPTNTDDRRVKINGTGTWIFSEASRFDIPRDAIVGIEGVSNVEITDNVGNDISALQTVEGMSTDMTWIFQDDAQFQIGSSSEFGGAFQVGNVVDTQFGDPAQPATVNFGLQFNGRNARMEVAGQGFFGLGAGIVSKPADAPNNWTIGSLSNVNGVTIDVREGKIIHNRIVDGSSQLASLLAVSEAIDDNGANGVSFVQNNSSSRILGGGNMIKITGGDTNINPTVGTTNDDDTGILAPQGILLDRSKTDAAQNGGITITGAQGRTVLGNDPQNVGGTPAADSAANAFSYLKMNNFNVQNSPLAAIYEQNLGVPVIGYVNNDTINRVSGIKILGLNGTATEVSATFENGSVGLSLAPGGSATAYSVAIG